MTPDSLITTNIDINHAQLGVVSIYVRSNTRKISARWKKGKVCITAPYGIRMADINTALEKFTPALLKNSPTLTYHENQTITCDGFSIFIKRQSLQPSKILGQPRFPMSTISVGSDLDFDSDATTKLISRMMCRIAQRLAAYILLPQARQLSVKVGISPLGWSISTGHRVLGRCNTDGFIALSYMLVFLPPHLRDYIIYHELAHLSEMNHSYRFHELCDKYCGGKESQLIAELKNYTWPVLR